MYKICLIVYVILLGACSTREAKDPDIRNGNNKARIVKYARHFSMLEKPDRTIVYLFGNRNNGDTTSTFVLYRGTVPPTDVPAKAYCLRVPCKKIAALSSIYATMFDELGALENLAAIDNIDYVNNPHILEKFKRGELKELQRNPELDLERTVALKPDVIFSFGMGEFEKGKDQRLGQNKIPMAISVDHLETSPLGRAEWIRFFAAFVDKKHLADSLFAEVEINYAHLKDLAQATKTRPSVFNEIKYGDAWYMPGGKSFMAAFLNDAGANYLWKDDTQAGSIPLSFEQVYAKAKDADYWINLSTLKTKKELLAFESRYSEFAACKNGNLFNNNKTTNANGYSIYWETGMIFPDRILSDLIQIFHPELKAEIKSDFYYYQRLK